MKRQAGRQHGHVAIESLVWGFDELHLLGLQIELVGNQQAQGTVHALPHFGVRHGQQRMAALVDLDPAIKTHLAFKRR